MKFKNVVIWGHPLHSHTHSYIHHGFHRAFRYMNYDAHWINEHANFNSSIFDSALVITEGQVDSKIPLNKTASYLLHNCDTVKYEESGINFKVLQVYSHDCLDRDVVQLGPAQYYQADNRTLYQTWATDLLPKEMDSIELITQTSARKPWCNWVGSVIYGDVHGNEKQLVDFATAASKKSVEFRICRNVSPEDGVSLIRESYLAPALQGAWQVANGYIPCRIYKNISYGHLGLTNSKAVHDALDGNIIYNQDCTQLFEDGVRAMEAPRESRRSVFEIVRNNHTYVNRAKSILEVMGY